MILKLEHALKSSGRLVKSQVAGIHPRVCESVGRGWSAGVCSWWCWCYWFRGHTLRTLSSRHNKFTVNSSFLPCVGFFVLPSRRALDNYDFWESSWLCCFSRLQWLTKFWSLNTIENIPFNNSVNNINIKVPMALEGRSEDMVRWRERKAGETTSFIPHKWGFKRDYLKWLNKKQRCNYNMWSWTGNHK